jgi:hypothetical protein
MPMQDDEYSGLLPEERALLEQNKRIADTLEQMVQMLGQVTQALMQHAQTTAMPKKRRIIRGPDGKAQGSVEEP